MATNFPDTTPPALNPDTGLEWAAGDTFDDTAESGLVYVWSPPVWKTSVEAIPETDARYVNVTGDNMEGNLRLGPDGGPAEITLDASTGNITGASAEFAGDVQMASQNGGPLAGCRNQIINGDFRVWQRGDSLTGIANAYGPDRLFIAGSGNDVRQRIDTLGSGLPFMCEFLNGSGSNRYRSMIEVPPNTSGSFLNTSVWTFSLFSNVDISGRDFSLEWTTDNNDVSAAVCTDVQQFESLGNNRYSCTLTVVGEKPAGKIGLRWTLPILGQEVDPVQVTAIQLEPGPVATPFEQRPIGTELALCQRYYQQGQHFMRAQPNTQLSGTVQAVPSFRVAPSINTSVTAGTSLTAFRATESSFLWEAVPDGFGQVDFTYTATAEL